MNSDSQPSFRIGIFDSGQGGLSVVHELEALTKENNIDIAIDYLADSDHFPYGTKSQEELDTIIRHNVELLVQKGANYIIVACNTASIAGEHLFPTLEKEYKKAILRVTDCISSIRDATKVLVIGTEFTVHSQYYQNKLRHLGFQVEDMAMQDLVSCIEENDTEGIQKELVYINEYVKKNEIDTILLGCTHYSLIRSTFEELIPSVKIVDPAYETASRAFIYIQMAKHGMKLF